MRISVLNYCTTITRLNLWSQLISQIRDKNVIFLRIYILYAYLSHYKLYLSYVLQSKLSNYKWKKQWLYFRRNNFCELLLFISQSWSVNHLLLSLFFKTSTFGSLFLLWSGFIVLFWPSKFNGFALLGLCCCCCCIS